MTEDVETFSITPHTVLHVDRPGESYYILALPGFKNIEVHQAIVRAYSEYRLVPLEPDEQDYEVYHVFDGTMLRMWLCTESGEPL